MPDLNFMSFLPHSLRFDERQSETQPKISCDSAEAMESDDGEAMADALLLSIGRSDRISLSELLVISHDEPLRVLHVLRDLYEQNFINIEGLANLDDLDVLFNDVLANENPLSEDKKNILINKLSASRPISIISISNRGFEKALEL